MALVALVPRVKVADPWNGNGTVLQLISHSSTRSNPSDSEDQVGYSHGFPILAVTRTKPPRKSADMTLRSSSLSSECSDSVKGNKSGNSSPKGSWRKVMASTENITRYSVQDLNKQTMSVNSKLSPDFRVSPASSFVCDAAALLNLPKPISRTNDVRTFLNQNGFLRTSTLTHGELELKRFNDSYVKDHSQHRKKKFKLNVNQLPRSTTPINDHDPDKLNMKQVIAFLQDQAIRPSTEHIHFNSSSEKNVLIQSSMSPSRDFNDKQTLKQGRCFSEPPISSFPSTRDIACYSVKSTKSTPTILKRIQNSARCGGARCSRQNTSNHVRPYSDIPGRNYKHQAFLSLEPNGSGLTTTPQYKIIEKYPGDKNLEPQELSVNYRSARFKFAKPNCEVKCSDTPSSGLGHNALFTDESAGVRKSSGEESSSESIKTEQSHIKKHSQPPAMNKCSSHSGISDISQSETKNEESSKSNDGEVIRMPALADFHDEWESNSDSEHEVPANITEAIFDPIKRLVIQRTDNSGKDQKPVTCSNGLHNISVVPERPLHLSNVFRYIPKHRQHRRMKAINVELPHANGPEMPKSDVIKLTMRQGNTVTRHTSYMSDIASEESDQSGQNTHLPIISMQDVHGTMMASTLQPMRERRAIQPATLSVIFNKDDNKENLSINTAVDFDCIRKKKNYMSI